VYETGKMKDGIKGELYKEKGTYPIKEDGAPYDITEKTGRDLLWFGLALQSFTFVSNES